MNKEYVENLTMAYIYSYNTAMQEVKNPNFAAQIAVSVITAIEIHHQPEHPKLNPFEMLFANIAAQAKAQKGEGDDRTENEAD